jgi:hypothetical protein
VRREALTVRVEVRDRPPLTLSQQGSEAEGRLTREAPGRAGASPDKAGTRQYCQMVWVRRAWRKGVREEPASLRLLRIRDMRGMTDGGSSPRGSFAQDRQHPAPQASPVLKTAVWRASTPTVSAPAHTPGAPSWRTRRGTGPARDRPARPGCRPAARAAGCRPCGRLPRADAPGRPWSPRRPASRSGPPRPPRPAADSRPAPTYRPAASAGTARSPSATCHSPLAHPATGRPSGPATASRARPGGAAGPGSTR